MTDVGVIKDGIGLRRDAPNEAGSQQRVTFGCREICVSRNKQIRWREQ